MRIGVDMMGVQDPGGVGRGIGRYVEQFVRLLVDSDPSNEYVLYFFDRLPVPAWAREYLPISRFVATPRRRLGDHVQKLVDRNTDRLELYLVTSPFSKVADYRLPERPADRLRMAAILYDLIPMVVDQEFYLHDESDRALYFERIARLRNYDLVLAISEATRQDALTHLGLPSRRVTNISSATRDGFFVPALSPDFPVALKAIGVRGPYILSVSGQDPRKNTEGLIRAFALLPAAIRFTHQLVIVCGMSPGYARKLMDLATARGVGDRLVLTGNIPDEKLREALQHCALFAFASHYEGFGLPILEAMLCGAPVVAGNNSSQIEVVGDAGLLARTSDDADLAEKIGRVLSDSHLAVRLRQRGRERARSFNWAETVRRTREAFQSLPGIHRLKPLLAFFSPLPPLHTGVADYSRTLLEGLREHYTIHLYHEAGELPHLAFANGDFAAFDYRLFDRHDRVWNYARVLYQMGNSRYHRHVYKTLLRKPGIVTLHDPRLAMFMAWRSEEHIDPVGHLQREVAYCQPELSRRKRYRLAEAAFHEFWGRAGMETADIKLNCGVLTNSLGVIVHDAGAADRLQCEHPTHKNGIHVIPHGTEVRIVSESERRALRKEFGLPPDSLIVGSFGIMHPNKLNRESVEAFAALARERPDALMIFVGEETDAGLARNEAAARGLMGQVRFLGYQAPADFSRLMATVDLAVNLRQPPTQGESSGSLARLMGLGIPTVVTDCGSFGSFPSDVVLKVPAGTELVARIADGLLDFARNAEYRRAFGERAREYAAGRFSWAAVIREYVAVIEMASASGSVAA